MKKLLITLIIFLLVLSFPVSKGIEIEIEPIEIWAGEASLITCRYSGIDNITSLNPLWAYIPRTLRNITENDFTKNQTDHSYNYDPPDNLLGTYNVYCSNGTANSSISSFTQSTLDLEIIDYSDTIYLGESLEIELKVTQKSDSEKILVNEISPDDFSVYLDNQEIDIDIDSSIPSGNSWILVTSEILDKYPSTYELKVNLEYMGEEKFDTVDIGVNSPFQFRLTNINKNWVKSDDNLTLTIESSYKNQPLTLSDYYSFDVYIGGEECEYSFLGGIGDKFDVKVEAPEMTPGNYMLNIRADYVDIDTQDEFGGRIDESLTYTVPIYGELVYPDGRPVNTKLFFKKEGFQWPVQTNGKGIYSSEIPRGTYDIELDFPRSNLILEDVEVNDFEDPVRYDEITSGFELEGIGINSIFVYEVALGYDEANLEMVYDDSLVPNEERITVYRCQKWNFGARTCNGEWKEVTSDIDTIRNEVSVNTITLSAFLIGYKKEMIIDANIEKDSYFLEDIVKVLGIVEDENQRAIEGVKITGEIKGTDITFTTETDSGGVFTEEFQGPSTEGKHELILTAEKTPYDDVEQALELEMIKSKKITLTVPNSLELKVGDSTNTEFLLSNIGQTDFYDLIITLDGISADFYSLGFTDIDEIKAGEEKRVPVSINLSDSVNEGSYPGIVRVRGEDVDLEESFTLKVQNKETTEVESSKSKFPSANIVIPNFSWETLAVSVFGVFSIGGAIWFKKKKQKPGRERENIKNMLLNIKSEVEKNNKPVKVKKKNKKNKSNDSVYYAR